MFLLFFFSSVHLFEQCCCTEWYVDRCNIFLFKIGSGHQKQQQPFGGGGGGGSLLIIYYIPQTGQFWPGNLCICLLYLILTKAVLLLSWVRKEMQAKAKTKVREVTGQCWSDYYKFKWTVCFSVLFVSSTTTTTNSTLFQVIHNLIRQSVSTAAAGAAAAHSTEQIHLKI